MICNKGVVIRCFSVMLLAVIALLPAGCAGGRKAIQGRLGKLSDSQLSTVIQRNIEQSGGLDAWAQTAQIEGVAIATIFEANGGKALVEQKHQITTDIPKKSPAIVVVSKEPGGDLREQLNERGRIKVWRKEAGKTYTEKDKSVLFGAGVKLLMEAQAMTGASTLLRKGLTLRYGGLERKGGRLNHKVEATGQLLDRGVEKGWRFWKWKKSPELQVKDTIVVWINDETSLIERVWLCYQKLQKPDEFGYLALQVSEYQEIQGGIKLPRRLEFMPSDAHQDFGSKPVLTVEFQDLRAVKEPEKRFPW